MVLSHLSNFGFKLSRCVMSCYPEVVFNWKNLSASYQWDWLKNRLIINRKLLGVKKRNAEQWKVSLSLWKFCLSPLITKLQEQWILKSGEWNSSLPCERFPFLMKEHHFYAELESRRRRNHLFRNQKLLNKKAQVAEDILVHSSCSPLSHLLYSTIL